MMPMRLLIAVLLVVSAFPAVGQAGKGLADAIDRKPAAPVEKAPEPLKKDVKSAEDPVVLETRQKVAQLMIVTLQGNPAPDLSDMELLKRYTPGGVVLPSLMKPKSAADYVTFLRSLPFETITGLPFLIGANMHELPKYGWGPRNCFPPLPSLMTIAAANDPEATAGLARLIADTMGIMGLNLHLGPTLELAPSLGKAEGDTNCLGSDPVFVAAAGETIRSALEAKGVATMPWGFPGGGMNQPSRKDPSVLLTSREDIMEQDLLPYRKAIEAGVDIIHVGCTLTPTLDPASQPACMSRAVVTGLLREELGFKGVIVAGPMDDPRITKVYDASDAAMMAFESGVDMLLWNTGGTRVMKTVDQAVAEIAAGKLSKEIIDASMDRVREFKKKRGLMTKPLPRIRDADKIEKNRAYSQEAMLIERKAIVLVQNRGGVLPLRDGVSMPVGVTGVTGVDELADALEEYIKLVPRQGILTAKHGGAIYDFEIDRIVKNISGAGALVITLTSDLDIQGQIELIKGVKSKGVKVVVLLLGYPRTLPDLAIADAILVAFSNTKAIDQCMKAAADVLMGQGAVGLIPPVRDITIKTGEVLTLNANDVIRLPAGQLPVTIAEPFVAGLSVPYDTSAAMRKVMWDFGDGKKGKDPIVEKAYETPGRYPITLTVIDQRKESTSQTFYVVVE